MSSPLLATTLLSPCQQAREEWITILRASVEVAASYREQGALVVNEVRDMLFFCVDLMCAECVHARTVCDRQSCRARVCRCRSLHRMRCHVCSVAVFVD